MISVNYHNDESYVEIINNLIKNFDSYDYISDEINRIINVIDKDINDIILDDSDDDEIKLIINLYTVNNYGFNYDFKNYPLLSFMSDKITIDYNDCVIDFGDVIIDISLLKFENFVKIE